MEKIIKLSTVNTINGLELAELSFNICTVDTMIDVEGNEVQIPRVLETTTASRIQEKIDKLQAEINELNSYLVSTKQIEITQKANI